MELTQSWKGAPLWQLPQLPTATPPMFVDPQEIIDNVESGTWFSFDDDGANGCSCDHCAGSSLYQRKLDEACENGTYDSIEADGIRQPIVLIVGRDGHVERTGNGHHRTAVAADLGMDLVPVIYGAGFDTWADMTYCQSDD